MPSSATRPASCSPPGTYTTLSGGCDYEELNALLGAGRQ
jgi:hypothetical protein